MSLLRLLFIAGIIWLLYRLIKKLTFKRNPDNRKTLETTHMVRCTYCDTYIIRQDACFREDSFFCSPDHYAKHIQKDSK